MISAPAELVRVSIYRGFAATGRCPAAADLAVATGLSALAIDSALAELDDSQHIVRRDGELVLAHPFATRSFGFSVMGRMCSGGADARGTRSPSRISCPRLPRCSWPPPVRRAPHRTRSW